MARGTNSAGALWCSEMKTDNGGKTMRHVKKVTVAKADAWTDVQTWFDEQWSAISAFFKGN